MPKNIHPNGDKFQQQKCSAFETARGSQFHQICCVVRHLKYKSTSACPPPCIFSKLTSCIIWVEIVFGFKIWLVWDPKSRLPLAMRFATIDVHDINFAKEVIQQAIVNLENHAKIASIAMDRGFMDGTLLMYLP